MYYFSNGNSFGDDQIVATLPWIFRHAVPGQHDRASKARWRSWLAVWWPSIALPVAGLLAILVFGFPH